MLEAGMGRVREKSLALTQRFIDGVETRCEGLGLRLATPREPEKRGSQVSWHHEQAFALVQALIERGVIGDYREPGIARFGFAPLYLRFEDVDRAVEHLEDLLRSNAWDQPRFKQRHAVT
jgi:kynureninase